MRLKRVDLPQEVSESVYRRMEAERKRVANELRSTGSAESEKIRADADRQREVITRRGLSRCAAHQGRGRRQGHRRSMRGAYEQNPEFYAFYRSLEAYRQSFKNKSDVLVLEPNSEFFKYLKSRAARPASSARARAARRRRAHGAMSNTLLTAFALMLVIEGVLPFLVPALWRETFRRLTEMSDGQMRFIGLTSMLAGLLLLYLVAPRERPDAT